MGALNHSRVAKYPHVTFVRSTVRTRFFNYNFVNTLARFLLQCIPPPPPEVGLPMRLAIELLLMQENWSNSTMLECYQRLERGRLTKFLCIFHQYILLT